MGRDYLALLRWLCGDLLSARAQRSVKFFLYVSSAIILLRRVPSQSKYLTQFLHNSYATDMHPNRTIYARDSRVTWGRDLTLTAIENIMNKQ